MIQAEATPVVIEQQISTNHDQALEDFIKATVKFELAKRIYFNKVVDEVKNMPEQLVKEKIIRVIATLFEHHLNNMQDITWVLYRLNLKNLDELKDDILMSQLLIRAILEEVEQDL